jgi:hypothetical protein
MKDGWQIIWMASQALDSNDDDLQDFGGRVNHDRKISLFLRPTARVARFFLTQKMYQMEKIGETNVHGR